MLSADCFRILMEFLFYTHRSVFYIFFWAFLGNFLAFQTFRNTLLLEQSLSLTYLNKTLKILFIKYMGQFLENSYFQ